MSNNLGLAIVIVFSAIISPLIIPPLKKMSKVEIEAYRLGGFASALLVFAFGVILDR
jgi:hypothetical protein